MIKQFNIIKSFLTECTKSEDEHCAQIIKRTTLIFFHIIVAKLMWIAMIIYFIYGV